jgi:hypothetical protein
MTTNVVRVPGNYTIETQDNGNILLNTGFNTGTVTISGSLNVKGKTTTIDAVNATIKDNVITLNYGEQSSWVSTADADNGSYTAGIIVDRGSITGGASTKPAKILFRDVPNFTSPTWTTPEKVGYGIWEFFASVNSPDTLGIGAIKVNAIRIDTNSAPKVGTSQYPTLNFFGGDLNQTNALLSVTGSGNYAQRVRDVGEDNIIPNKRYVDDAVLAAGQTAYVNKLTTGTTSVTIYDIAYTGLPSNVRVSFNGQDKLVIAEDSIRTAGIGDTGLIINDSVITAYNKTTPGSDADLYLEVTGNGSVYVGQNLNLLNQSVIPTATTNTTALYATGTIGAGGTGIYYTNKDQTGEFISRKKAIIYGLIF